MGKIVNIENIYDNCVSNGWDMDDVETLLQNTIVPYKDGNKALCPTFEYLSKNELSSILTVNNYCQDTSLMYIGNQLVNINDVSYNLIPQDNEIRVHYILEDSDTSVIDSNSIELNFTIYNDTEYTEVLDEITYTGPSKTITQYSNNDNYYESFLVLPAIYMNKPTRLYFNSSNNFTSESYISFYNGDYDQELPLGVIANPFIYLRYGLQHTKDFTIVGSTTGNMRTISITINNELGVQTMYISSSQEYNGYNDVWVQHNFCAIENGYKTYDINLDYNVLCPGTGTSFYLKINFPDTLYIVPNSFSWENNHNNYSPVLRFKDDTTCIFEIHTWTKEHGKFLINMNLGQYPEISPN